MKNPTPKEVKSLRESVQRLHNYNITTAQDWCANALHTSRRAWQQWEAGNRRMHPAFWELANIKAEPTRQVGGPTPTLPA